MLSILADALLLATGQTPNPRRENPVTDRPIRAVEARRPWFNRRAKGFKQ